MFLLITLNGVFATFPSSLLAGLIKQELGLMLKFLFVVLRKKLHLRYLKDTEYTSDVHWFSHYTFNSACYFSFYCDMFRI